MAKFNKKIFLTIFFILPTFIFNYFTLTVFDHDHNLSFFSTVFIIILNLTNIFFVIIYYYFNFKTVFFLLTYCLVLFSIFDFALEKVINKKSIIKEDSKLGWVLKANKKINFNQKTMNGDYYTVQFSSSEKDGFREYGKINSKNKKILVIGDSYTAGPYSSNKSMYYNIIRSILDENNITFEWFVLATQGYGTIQQLLLLEDYNEIIQPDVILHQFCVNDFFDNSYKISKLSTSHNQYYRRPYFIDNEIKKIDNIVFKIYRFLYKNSFIFKKFDQIYTYKQLRNYGRFTKQIPKEYINNSIKNTHKLIYKIRELVGKDKLYFSINCADEKNNYLNVEWKNIIKKINGIPLEKPSNILIEQKKNGIDVMHEDGGHLNTLGNKIYGEIIAYEMLKILKNDQYK